MTRKLFASMFLFLMVLTPVIAKAEVTPSSMDMSAVFASNEINATVLSQQEMKETEGAWVNYAIGAGYGALGGGIGYGASTWASGSRWSWPAFTGSVAGGAVAGAFLNPAWGATAGAAVSGVMSGYSSRYPTWSSVWRRR